jgi:hypothetical protein
MLPPDGCRSEPGGKARSQSKTGLLVLPDISCSRIAAESDNYHDLLAKARGEVRDPVSWNELICIMLTPSFNHAPPNNPSEADESRDF